MIQRYALNDDPWAGEHIDRLMPPWANSCQPKEWVGKDGVIFRHDKASNQWIFATDPDTLSPEHRAILESLLAKGICAPYAPEPGKPHPSEPHHSI